jgi:periplasmic protein CpxP/Spy
LENIEEKGKKMSTGTRLRLGLAIVGVLMAGSVLAQGPGGGVGSGPGNGPGFGEHRPPFERAFGLAGDHGRWWNNPKIVEQLKLTDEQRKAMDDIMLQHRETLIDLRASVDKAELGMEPLMGQDQPDEAKILSQIDTVAQARAELEKANARFLLALRGKLTPEQWKQVQAFRASHAQDRPHWGHDGQGASGQYRRQSPPPGAGPQGPVPQSMLGPGPGTDGAGSEGSIALGAGDRQ